MATAARLLYETDKTLDQLATAIGYGSAFAFAKAFRREYAITPGDYRIACRVAKTALPDVSSNTNVARHIRSAGRG